MCNLGQGIREQTAIATAIATKAGIVMNIMNNESKSFDDAFDSTYLPEEDRDDVRAFVDGQMAVTK